MFVTKHLPVHIDFHSLFFPHTMEVNGDQQLFGYRHYTKYNFSCSAEEKTHTGLEQLEGE